ncbi:hypothetical protein D5F01_LYC03517 [Larimichthys crocea]|uniref:DUF6570 domain-containing protein n=1 Tax=Larimichthys crocea TaxID=215358 RepID=A0A6G0IZF7_LARCR|nr:hypothetical protein D5F01_LYC03517 [Larimichthys crocea]
MEAQLQSLSTDVSNAILIVSPECIAVFRDRSGRYGVFDSHSRNARGLPYPDGTAIVLIFSHLSDLISHLHRLFEDRGVNASYEFVPVSFDPVDKSCERHGTETGFGERDVEAPKMSSVVLQPETNAKTQETKSQTTSVVTQQHNDVEEVVKNVAKLGKQLRHKFLRRASKSKKTENKSGQETKKKLYSIRRYKTDLDFQSRQKKYMAQRYNEHPEVREKKKAYATSRMQEWICYSCDDHLRRGNLPTIAVANKLGLAPIPLELAELNVLERQLIAKVLPFAKIVALPKDAPEFGDLQDDSVVIKFIDQYITCQMPDPNADPELHKIVSEVQLHSRNHSKSCKKGNVMCRFGFPKLPMDKTILTYPTPDDDDDDDNDNDQQQSAQKNRRKGKKGKRKSRALRLRQNEAKDKLQTLRNYISDPNVSFNNFSELLEKCNLTYEEYKKHVTNLTMSNVIVLKRHPKECWVNGYNPDLLRGWNAKMDIQFVLDEYS